ncbi:MAG: Tfx family DNA-binding protein [Conexivisphaera sp.]
MRGRRRVGGFLTERQLEILRMRRKGMSYEEVAKVIGTTKENVMILEKRAIRNIRLAKETIESAAAVAGEEILIPKGTRLVDVPPMIVDRANSVGLKLSLNMPTLMAQLSGSLRNLVRDGVLTEDVRAFLLPDGSVSLVADERVHVGARAAAGGPLAHQEGPPRPGGPRGEVRHTRGPGGQVRGAPRIPPRGGGAPEGGRGRPAEDREGQHREDHQG